MASTWAHRQAIVHARKVVKMVLTKVKMTIEPSQGEGPALGGQAVEDKQDTH